MRLDAQPPYIWRQINQVIKEKLGGSNQVFLYRGMHHAIFETLMGLHLRFTHKRKLVTEIGLGDHLSHSEVELAKLGVRFKTEFETDMAKEEKACLAYIHDLDDALTGELYNHIETLKKVAGGKIYRIHLAHHLFQVKKSFVKNLSEYDIIIVSLSRDYALVLCGEKVSFPLLSAPQLPWSIESDARAVVQLMDKQVKLFQPEISQFESALPSKVRPWFRKQSARRIYDRAVVTLEGYDGAAMMSLLNQALKVESSPLGGDNAIETLSQCRWQNEVWYQQAERFDKTPEQIQGTIIISGALVNTALSQVFKECLQKLDKLST